MKLNRVLLAILLALPAVAGSPPNILVIIADDLGAGDYSAFGTSDIRTPNIDRLAREGMIFENFYANSCACSPTRAALLTGCYPDRVGVPGVIRYHRDNSWGWLSPRATLLPQVLKRTGYHSAVIGKWHLGFDPPNIPTERGFDFFHGFLGDMMEDYWTHLRHGQNFMRRNREVVEPKGHATDVFTEWACEYLRERAGKRAPFFLYLAYNAPHDPIQPPPEWLEKVKQREPSSSPQRQKLVALIEHLDAGIGKVLDTLDRLKLADNTLVIFTSDNGGHLRFAANNGPWRSGKTHLYEGGIRVPGIVRWPAKIKPGSRTAHVALSMDIFATSCEAAGLEPPPDIDGVSFLPALLGRPQPKTKRDLYFVLREGGTARFCGRTIEALIRGDWKLVCDNPFGPAELYNLRRDPQETTDLAEKEKAVFRELALALARHVQRGGSVPWQPPE
ncbi:MAG: sulfatase-like hydrolase/transferase [Verrucomicrobiae bacterium]|nr:sulfatase-like hydrolase/transferase [Verrucomicrobiae bacterium]